MQASRIILKAGACLSALVLTTFLPNGILRAQDFPARPIRIVITEPPGGGVDRTARLVADKLREKWGQPGVVETHAGAGGNIAAELTAKSPNDGYSVMMGTVGTHAINLALYSKLPYHPQRDFTPIALVGENPNILVINPVVPAKSIKELIALGKAKPGQLNYGSSGAGTTVHLSGELFKVLTGIDMVGIVYKGGGPALVALMSGEIELVLSSLASTLPHVRSGKLRVVAVTGAKRSPAAPELPTVSEAALPGYEATAWFGLAAPAGVPRAGIERMHGETVRVLKLPDVVQRMRGEAYDIIGDTPEQFAQAIRTEIAKWAAVVKHAGLIGQEPERMAWQLLCRQGTRV